jgi:hypothetical protein
MENSTTSNISGDDNKVIQGITAGRDIIIKISGDLPDNIKEQKKAISRRIEDLVKQLNELMDCCENKDETAIVHDKPDNPVYRKIKWRRLIKAIKHQGCVLFIGPEISVDDKGVSLHYKFYKNLTRELDDVEYMEKEGFFSPGADEEILYDVLDFYKDDFQHQNKVGRNVLEKLAQFPFSLIISLCPDDTIHHVFNDFDLEHKFLFFDGTKKEIDFSDEEVPIIYNILGSASENGRYIFTHANLYNFLLINEKIVPPVIKKKLQDATHFLFIGFDFSKWYNRLLLFVLEFKQKQAGVDRLYIEKKDLAEEFEKFIEKQFDITSIHHDYDEFINWLTRHAREEEGLLKDLSQSFIHSNFTSLQKMSVKVSDETKLEALLKINNDADVIQRKVESFKTLLNQ